MNLRKKAKNTSIYMFALWASVIASSCNESKKENKVDTETKIESSSNEQVAEATDLPPYMADGEKVYVQNCLICHQSDGAGVSGLNPPISNTEYVNGDKIRLLGILINGSNVGLVVNGSTYSNAMPAFSALSNTEISNVASYIRNSFGNSAEPISADEVATFRSTIKK